MINLICVLDVWQDEWNVRLLLGVDVLHKVCVFLKREGKGEIWQFFIQNHLLTHFN